MPVVFIDDMNAALDPITTIDAPACRCLRLECPRLSTPTRSTSTASANACGGKPAVSGQMPALATTMSRRPSSATPRSIAADRATRAPTPAVAGVPRVCARGDYALALLLAEPGGLVEILRASQRVFVGLDVRAQVNGDDVGAFGRQHSRVRATLTARGPTDYRDLARYSAHRRPFVKLTLSAWAQKENAHTTTGIGRGS